MKRVKLYSALLTGLTALGMSFGAFAQAEMGAGSGSGVAGWSALYNANSGATLKTTIALPEGSRVDGVYLKYYNSDGRPTEAKISDNCQEVQGVRGADVAFNECTFQMAP